MAAIDDLVSNLKNGVTNLGQLIIALQSVFPRVAGSFTLTAAATTTVTQAAIAANSLVFVMAANAPAASLMGSAKSLYVSALTPGASFAVTTASGAAAAGTETFFYFVISPA